MMVVGLLISLQLLQIAGSYTPHFIIITVDDVGFNDIVYNQGDPGDILSTQSHIKRFADASLKLHNYYVMPNGHSTRSAIMTGKHPAVLGTQFETKDQTARVGLKSDETILPQYLRKLGYETHYVGQWDLGFYSDAHLPTNRGYQSFFGSYLSYGGYTTHMASDEAGNRGYDLHNNDRVERSAGFKPELYTKRAQEIIENHDATKPLHLYVAFQAAQMKNISEVCGSDPQIPNEYLRKVVDVSDESRKCYLALLNAVDLAFERIMRALRSKAMLENSIVIFSSTSGGPAAGYGFNAASNSPLRGTKNTGWEGGVKGIAFIYNTGLNNVLNSRCLFHATDWLPTILTLYSQASHKDVSPLDYSKLYGRDQFQCLYKNGNSNRTSVIHFLYGESASAMYGNYKLLIDRHNHLQLKDRNEWYNVQPSRAISCRKTTGVECDPSHDQCLYDISQDPCEKDNIAPRNEDTIASIMQHLIDFNKTVNYNNLKKSPDPDGSPLRSSNVWQPWISNDVGALQQSFLCLLVTTVTILLP